MKRSPVRIRSGAPHLQIGSNRLFTEQGRCAGFESGQGLHAFSRARTACSQNRAAARGSNPVRGFTHGRACTKGQASRSCKPAEVGSIPTASIDPPPQRRCGEAHRAAASGSVAQQVEHRIVDPSRAWGRPRSSPVGSVFMGVNVPREARLLRMQPEIGSIPMASTLSSDRSSAGRALPCHGRGREFDSRRSLLSLILMGLASVGKDACLTSRRAGFDSLKTYC
jgi:hypothetical protein